MKKVFLLLSFFVLITATKAQVKFGIKSGMNISNITGAEDKDDYRSKTGFHIGAFATVPITNELSVQPEVFYSMQGARWDDDNEKTSLNYLQVPLLAKYTTVSGFFVVAGPQAGFLLKAEDYNEGEKEDVKQYLKKTDISLAIGAGYNFFRGAAINVRYNAGLVKFYENEKNSVIQIGMSYTFGGRSK